LRATVGNSASVNERKTMNTMTEKAPENKAKKETAYLLVPTLTEDGKRTSYLVETSPRDLNYAIDQALAKLNGFTVPEAMSYVIEHENAAWMLYLHAMETIALGLRDPRGVNITEVIADCGGILLKGAGECIADYSNKAPIFNAANRSFLPHLVRVTRENWLRRLASAVAFVDCRRNDQWDGNPHKAWLYTDLADRSFYCSTHDLATLGEAIYQSSPLQCVEDMEALIAAWRKLNHHAKAE